MSNNPNSGPIDMWHCRILGGLWALCGILAVTYAFETDGWTDRRFWILTVTGLLYFVIGVGFILGRPWARNTMILLAGFTVIILMFLAAGACWIGDGRLLERTLVGLCLAGYTVLFEIVAGFVRQRRT